MIYDQLSRRAIYRDIQPGLDLAFDYLASFDPEIPDGKYPLDGERVYALVQSYLSTPAPEKKFESHRRYIDLQYVASGKEIIYHSPLERLTPLNSYNEEKDYTLYEGEHSQALVMGEGDFAVLFPDDGHKPGCSLNDQVAMKKVVLKIAL